MVEQDFYSHGWWFHFSEFVPGVRAFVHHSEFVSVIDDYDRSEDLLRFCLWADFIVWVRTIHTPYTKSEDHVKYERVRTFDDILGIDGESCT